MWIEREVAVVVCDGRWTLAVYASGQVRRMDGVVIVMAGTGWSDPGLAGGQRRCRIGRRAGVPAA